MEKTVRNALDLGAEGVLLYCGRCLHQRVFAPRAALKLWGGDALFTDIVKRALLAVRGEGAHGAGALEDALARWRAAAGDCA